MSNWLAGLGAACFDLLVRLPYFRGKGRLALTVLHACKSALPLKARTRFGGHLWLGDDDAGSLLLPYLVGKYESELYYVLMRCLSHPMPNDCFIDVGANVGFYSISAAYYFHRVKAGRVHSFEPNPRAFAYLEQNRTLNDLPNLCINRLAIADSPGALSMYVSPVTVTIGSLRQVESSLTQTIQVPVTTIDDYMTMYPDQKVRLIKIDIEGGELLALRGSRRTIERDTPIVIFEEYEGFYQAFGYSRFDIRSYLQSSSYNLYVIRPRPIQQAYLVPTSAQQVGQFTATQNILAVPPDKLAFTQLFAHSVSRKYGDT